MPKILLACPISDYKSYIIWDWLKYIQKLTYPVDNLLVDNSNDVDSMLQISKQYPNITVAHIQQRKDDVSRRHVMAESMEFIRYVSTRLIDTSKKYDYLFSLECDVFPPLNIIEKLLKIDGPVVGATYFINHGADSKLMLQRIEPKYFGNDSIVRMLTQDESFLFCDGTVKHVFSCGFGCVLIKTEVLKKVKFRAVDDPEGKLIHHDNTFFLDIYKQQIPVKVDTSIICKHFNSSWHKIFQKENKLINHER
jgi:hypothetical protein